MTYEQIKERINDALEEELGKIYTEQGITSGDISPWDSQKWDRNIEEMATLFERLIIWNTEEN